MGAIYADPNITDYYEIFTYANSLTSNLFGSIVLFALFLVAFMSLKANYSTARSMVTAGFICSIIGVFLFLIPLISMFTLLVFVFITGVGAVFLYWEEKD